MKTVAMIFAISILALGLSAQATTFTGSYDGAKAAVVKAGKPLLVEFYTEW